MNKAIIDVELQTIESHELLVFNFDKPIHIDLTSSDADELKTFFQELLRNVVNKDVELNFLESDRNDLFYDVAKKYVEHLKTEVSSIVTQKLNEVPNTEKNA
jgi:hypothetical protein